jgi:hypothetical protein
MTISKNYQGTLYWATTIATVLAFLVPGIGNLTHAPHIAKDMAHLGYPDYFMTILGSWKILGAVIILIPNTKRIKEWAYAGMIFDLTGAAISRLVAGDKIPMVIIPVFLACLVLVSWVLRPQNRKL